MFYMSFKTSGIGQIINQIFSMDLNVMKLLEVKVQK